MSNVVAEYLGLLQSVFNDEDAAAFAHTTGASASDLGRVEQAYPQMPAELKELLLRVDGTWGRTYGEHYVLLYMFGTDLGGEEEGYDYPYYLNSCEDILSERYDESIIEQYGEEMVADGDVGVAPEIDPTIPMSRRLQFANCMNQGGTSQLFIDFDPTPQGTVGQVISFVHDPDDFFVVAPSFRSYLETLIKHEGSFITTSYELDAEINGTGKHAQ